MIDFTDEVRVVRAMCDVQRAALNCDWNALALLEGADVATREELGNVGAIDPNLYWPYSAGIKDQKIQKEYKNG